MFLRSEGAKARRIALRIIREARRLCDASGESLSLFVLRVGNSNPKERVPSGESLSLNLNFIRISPNNQARHSLVWYSCFCGCSDI